MITTYLNKVSLYDYNNYTYTELYYRGFHLEKWTGGGAK